ncbi:MAG: hypothetical protein WBW41_13520 [Verrucomicrobiia bacterium]
MELPVELNKTRKIAKIVFAEPQHDFGFLAEWREQLGGDKTPVRLDAVDFAELAHQRFFSQITKQPYANSIENIGDHIAHDSTCEVASFVLLKCDWFHDSGVIGVSHFHRTWNNNIFLDFLTVHPFIAEAPSAYPQKVRGVGTGLLYFKPAQAKEN